MQKFLFFCCLTLIFAACTPKETNSDNSDNMRGFSSEVATSDTPALSAPITSTTTVVEADLPSPRKEMIGNVEGVNLTINYGSPAVKGRKLWGSLVPYDRVWRTGANEATRITTDRDIAIGEAILPSGTYGLFTVPTAGGWEVIFNSAADQWGAYEYDSEKDVLRVSAQPQPAIINTEYLEFLIKGNQLILNWGKLIVPLTINAA